MNFFKKSVCTDKLIRRTKRFLEASKIVSFLLYKLVYASLRNDCSKINGHIWLSSVFSLFKILSHFNFSALSNFSIKSKLLS